MIGFGFMDNTIMIHAGHFVDATLGVTFGLSTLAAAGIGQIASGIGGVIFGDALDGIFSRALGSRHMTKAQKAMRSSRLAGVAGGCIGVSVGCVLGLVNLLLVDEARVSQLKLRALEEGQEFEFEVEADNERHPGYTTVTVRGPDVDGVLASISAAIASAGCSVVELTAENRDKAKRGDAMDSEDGSIAKMVDHLVHPNRTHFEDVFLIKDRATQQAIGNDDLDGLARSVLSAAKDPLNSHSLKNQLEAMRIENDALVKRITILEDLLDRRQIKLVPSAPRQESEEK